MNVWTRQTIRTLRDPLFHAVLQLSHWSASPFVHLLHTLQEPSLQELTEEALSQGSVFQRLVCGKARALAASFDECFGSSGDMLIAAAHSRFDPDTAAVFGAFAGCLVVHNAAAFDRRILRRVMAFPFRLLILVQDPRDMLSAERQAVAQELLSTADDDLEDNARKIKSIFHQSIRHAAVWGLLEPSLFNFLKMVALAIKSDVQEVEGANSIVKTQCKRNTRMGLDLLSARVQLRKALGGGTHAERDSSVQKDRQHSQFQILHKGCCGAFNGAMQRVLGDVERFGEAGAAGAGGVPGDDAVEGCIAVTAGSSGAARLGRGAPGAPQALRKPVTVGLRWAAPFVAKLAQATKRLDASYCILFGSLDHTSTKHPAYLVAEAVYSARVLCKCSYSSSELTVDTPLTFVPALELVASMHTTVCGETEREVPLWSVPLLWSNNSFQRASLVQDRATLVTTLRQLRPGRPRHRAAPQPAAAAAVAAVAVNTVNTVGRADRQGGAVDTVGEPGEPREPGEPTTPPDEVELAGNDENDRSDQLEPLVCAEEIGDGGGRPEEIDDEKDASLAQRLLEEYDGDPEREYEQEQSWAIADRADTLEDDVNTFERAVAASFQSAHEGDVEARQLWHLSGHLGPGVVMPPESLGTDEADEAALACALGNHVLVAPLGDAEPMDVKATAAFATWAKEWDKSRSALEHQARRAGQPTSRNLSLVELTAELADDIHEFGITSHYIFVHRARDVPGRWGRAVHLDPASRVVYSTPSFHKARDLSTARIVVADTGVAMQRVAAKFRPTLPASVLRLKDMLEAATSPSPGHHLPLGIDCALCGLELVGDDDSRDKHSGRMCACCLLPWHNACSSSIMEHPKMAAWHHELKSKPEFLFVSAESFLPGVLCGPCNLVSWWAHAAHAKSSGPEEQL